jgi:hypothetical protein
MSVKALFAIVVAAALAGIGIRLAAGPNISGANYTCDSDHSTDTCGFLASPTFSAGEYERERLDRHQRSMRANPRWAMHEHVDLWRDVPGPNNSQTYRTEHVCHVHE